MTMDNMRDCPNGLKQKCYFYFFLFIYSARGTHKGIEQSNLFEMVFTLHIHVLVAQPFEELGVKSIFT